MRGGRGRDVHDVSKFLSAKALKNTADANPEASMFSVQAFFEFRGFDIRGLEYSRFIISPKLLVLMPLI